MRRALAALLILAVLTAGCGGSGGGGGGSEDPIVVAASPATIDESARSAAGYERVASAEETHNTSVTLTIQGDVQANPTFAVTATVHQRVYRRPGGQATVGVLSEPTIKPSEALASRVDPFRGRSPATLVANATGVAAADLRHRENRTVRMLGNETTARLFDATVSREGGTSDATVVIVAVRDGTDTVTAVAVYPRSTGEFPRIERLLAGVQH